MSDSWPGLLVAVGLFLLLLALVVGLVLSGSTYRAVRGARGRHRPDRSTFHRDRRARRLKRSAIIINPTKFDDVAAVTAELTAASTAHGWAEPLVLETTADDPGTGQARQALEEGVDLVCPLGGDGTIRAVAVALAHTRVPMGLLPRGTGNLLARNLDVPLADLPEALRVAFTGRNRAIDVAWVELDPQDEAASDDEGQAEEPVEGPPVRRHPFLVMAGMGLDAAIMGNTSEPLKERLGWVAYALTGLRSIFIRRFGVTWTVDGQEQPRRDARTIVVGSCGTLTGGITLMPEAQVDDGTLDAVVVSPRTIVGWAGLAGRVLSRSRTDTARLTRATGSDIRVVVDRRQLVQVDGDVIGEADRLRLTVDPQALIVRVQPR